MRENYVLSYLIVVFVCCLLICPPHYLCDGEDYYALLGVHKDASDKAIKKAFHKLAVKYHPDKNNDPDAREKFEKIANGNSGDLASAVIIISGFHAAYDVLSDPDKRRHYDRFGNSGHQEQHYHNEPFDFDAFFGRSSDSNIDSNGFFNFNFDDMFKDDFFGEGESLKV